MLLTRRAYATHLVKLPWGGKLQCILLLAHTVWGTRYTMNSLVTEGVVELHGKVEIFLLTSHNLTHKQFRSRIFTGLGGILWLRLTLLTWITWLQFVQNLILSNPGSSLRYSQRLALEQWIQSPYVVHKYDHQVLMTSQARSTALSSSTPAQHHSSISTMPTGALLKSPSLMYVSCGGTYRSTIQFCGTQFDTPFLNPKLHRQQICLLCISIDRKVACSRSGGTSESASVQLWGLSIQPCSLPWLTWLLAGDELPCCWTTTMNHCFYSAFSSAS